MEPTPIAATTAARRAIRAGQMLAIGLIALASLSGALALSLLEIHPLPLLPADLRGPVLLSAGWLLLTGWALLYALLLRRGTRLSPRRALGWAALCHAPLLLLAVPLWALFTDTPYQRLYSQDPLGRSLLQALAVDYLVLAPVLGQALLLATLRRASWIRHWPVVTLALLALALRLSHAGWGLPALLHPDEHRYYGPATIMAARGDLNPHYFQNPSLMIYLTYLTLLLLAPQSRAFLAMDEFFNLGIPNPRGDFLDMVALRGIVAALGVLTVVATYLAGRELFSRRTALVGSSILAVSFLQVRNSHYATNDVLAAALLTLSFLFAARIYTRGQRADYLLAALFGGLGTSAKYNVGFFAVAILVAHLARLHRDDLETPIRRSHAPLVAAGALSLGAFLLGTPYALLDFPAFSSDFRDQLAYGADPWFGQQAQPSAWIFLSTLTWGFGLLPLLLAAVGTLAIARSRKGALLLLLSVPACYFLFMSTQRLFFARFALPVLPFLALLAGYAVVQTTRRRAGAGRRRYLLVLLVTVTLAQPLALSLQHDRLLGKADTRFLAAQWIDANLTPGESLATESYSLLDPKFGWRGHKVADSFVFWPENDQSRGRAMSGSYRFVVVSSFGYGPWQSAGGDPTALPPQYRPLEARGRLVALFAPGQGNRELPYAIDDMYTPFWHLFDRERPGPTVRIYQMDGG